MENIKYNTDLNNQEWNQIRVLFPRKKKRGRNKKHSCRDIVCAIFYVIKAGCAWRLLPNDYPPWSTVYYYFKTWNKSGLWKKINDRLKKKQGFKLEETKFQVLESLIANQ